jgi:hypothetical protein
MCASALDVRVAGSGGRGPGRLRRAGLKAASLAASLTAQFSVSVSQPMYHNVRLVSHGFTCALWCLWLAQYVSEGESGPLAAACVVQVHTSRA